MSITSQRMSEVVAPLDKALARYGFSSAEIMEDGNIRIASFGRPDGTHVDYTFTLNADAKRDFDEVRSDIHLDIAFYDDSNKKRINLFRYFNSTSSSSSQNNMNDIVESEVLPSLMPHISIKRSNAVADTALEALAEQRGKS